MDLKDLIKQLAEKINQQKANILTEEATKNAFIMPFINALGYDVFNPLEVVPEMDCDLVKKKGEKIDYAIMKDGAPIILIECKHWHQDLLLHDTQLKKYFVASKAKFGVLTNGIRYLFYTDLENQNIMDDKPFLELDITDVKDYQLVELKKFHKSYFNIDDILSSASGLKYSTELKKIFAEELVNPTPEFVKYFAKKVYDGVITSKVQDQFSELVKRAFNSYINELISKRLKTALNSEEQREATETISAHAESEPVESAIGLKDGVVTTQEELDGFNIVRAIVRKSVDVSRVVYRDALTYFSILLDDNNRKPICRLYFNGKNKKYISTFKADKTETKHEISDLNEIFSFEDELCEIIKIHDNK
jgi:prophage lp2 protein 6